MSDRNAIVAVLAKRRFSLVREKETQAEIADAFQAAAIKFDREVDLGKRNIIDFLIGSIGVEVKIDGQKRAIYRQCQRYCESGKLSSLILATNVATGFPDAIANVPCFVVSLGRAWL